MAGATFTVAGRLRDLVLLCATNLFLSFGVLILAARPLVGGLMDNTLHGKNLPGSATLAVVSILLACAAGAAYVAFRPPLASEGRSDV